jgi:hypothetical protein
VKGGSFILERHAIRMKSGKQQKKKDFPGHFIIGKIRVPV